MRRGTKSDGKRPKMIYAYSGPTRRDKHGVKEKTDIIHFKKEFDRGKEEKTCHSTKKFILCTDENRYNGKPLAKTFGRKSSVGKKVNKKGKLGIHLS